MIRYAWALNGLGFPDLTTDGPIHKLGISRLYWAANDSQVDSTWFDEARKSRIVPNGVEVGFVYAPYWDDYPAPEAVATKMDGLVKQYGANAKQMAVMLDQEEHDADYTLAILRSWRVLRPTRPTAWTLEGHQDWISQDLANFVNADPNLLVLPQLYTGVGGSIDQPIEGGAELRRYAMNRANGGLGVFPSRVLGFHSPRWRLPAWWEGCLFLESWAQLGNAA